MYVDYYIEGVIIKLGLIFALIAAVMWGIIPIAIKLALPAFDPITIVWYRFTISALILSNWFCYKKYFIPLSTLKNPFFIKNLIIASLGLLSNFVLFATAVKNLTATTSQVVAQLGIVIFMVASVFVFKEKLYKTQILGVIILILGLIFFFNTSIVMMFDEFQVLGFSILLFFIASCCWAIYALAQKVLLKSIRSEQLLWLIYVISSILLFYVASPSQLFKANAIQLGSLIFCGINTIISYGALTFAMQKWQATKVGAITTLTPLFALFFSDLFAFILPSYFEMQLLNILGYIGAFLVVIGAMIATVGKQKAVLNPKGE